MGFYAQLMNEMSYGLAQPLPKLPQSKTRCCHNYHRHPGAGAKVEPDKQVKQVKIETCQKEEGKSSA